MATESEIVTLLGWLAEKFPAFVDDDPAVEAAKLPMWLTALQAVSTRDLKRGCQWVQTAQLEVAPGISTFRMMCVPPVPGAEEVPEKKTGKRTEEQRAFSKRLVRGVGNSLGVDPEDWKRAYRELIALNDITRDGPLRRMMEAQRPDLVAEVRSENP